jgi:hypothetical protein
MEVGGYLGACGSIPTLALLVLLVKVSLTEQQLQGGGGRVESGHRWDGRQTSLHASDPGSALSHLLFSTFPP